MKFKITFWQAIDWTSFFFIEKYIYHSQYISKFFFGLHNSFLLLNYNNSFICIKRSLNFIESLILHRNNIMAIGEFYNFFLKYIKLFKYFTVFNFKYLPDGFLTNFKNYFLKLKLSTFGLNNNKVKLSFFKNSRFILNHEIPDIFEYERKPLPEDGLEMEEDPNLHNPNNHEPDKKDPNVVRKLVLLPPSALLLFNLRTKAWIINEVKILRIPLIGLVYPETELNSILVHYPIPVLHGLSKDLLINYKEQEELDIFAKDLEILIEERKERVRLWKAQGYIVHKVKGFEFLKDYKEDPIHIFFLQLFLLTIYQSYKKLILKFTNKTLFYLKNNYSNTKIVKYNSLSLIKYKISRKFYTKSFLKLYNLLSSRIRINSNLFFSNRNIKYTDRKLYFKKQKHNWSIRKIDWKLGKFFKFKIKVTYNKPLFWIQKKHVITFKGMNYIKQFKYRSFRFFPSLKTVIKRNLIFKPRSRLIAYQDFLLNKNRKTRLSNSLSLFFLKTIRKGKPFVKYNLFATNKDKNKNKKFLKTKILNPFFNYYSARYWWIFKRPLLAYLSYKNKSLKLSNNLFLTKKGILNFNKFNKFNSFKPKFSNDLSFRFLPLKLNRNKNYSFFFTHRDRFLIKFQLKPRYLKKKNWKFFLVKYRNLYLRKTKNLLFDYKRFLVFNSKYNLRLNQDFKFNKENFLQNSVKNKAFLNQFNTIKSKEFKMYNASFYNYNIQKDLSLNFKNSGYFLSKTKFVSDSFIKNTKFKLEQKKKFFRIFRFLYNKNKLLTTPLVRYKNLEDKELNNEIDVQHNFNFLSGNINYNKFQNLNSKYMFIKSYLIFIAKYGIKDQNRAILSLLKLALKSKNNILIDNLFLNIKSKLYSLYKADVAAVSAYKKKMKNKKFKYKVKLKFNKNFSINFLKKWEKLSDKIGEDSTFLNLRLFLKKKSEYKQQDVELIKNNDQSTI